MENNSHNKIFIYLLVVFLAIFIGSGLFLIMNNKKTATNEPAATANVVQKEVVIPTLEMSKSYINLKNDLALNQLTNPLNLTLTANSNGENITAFDTLISYDPLSFDFVKAESLDPNFKIYPYKNDNNLTLTVVKTGPSSVSTVFKDNKIISLVFQPKKTGQFVFKVLPTIGKETSKFVNEKTQIIYPSVNEIKVTIN